MKTLTDKNVLEPKGLALDYTTSRYGIDARYISRILCAHSLVSFSRQCIVDRVGTNMLSFLSNYSHTISSHELLDK